MGRKKEKQLPSLKKAKKKEKRKLKKLGESKFMSNSRPLQGTYREKAHHSFTTYPDTGYNPHTPYNTKPPYPGDLSGGPYSGLESNMLNQAVHPYTGQRQLIGVGTPTPIAVQAVKTPNFRERGKAAKHGQFKEDIDYMQPAPAIFGGLLPPSRKTMRSQSIFRPVNMPYRPEQEDQFHKMFRTEHVPNPEPFEGATKKNPFFSHGPTPSLKRKRNAIPSSPSKKKKHNS